MTAPKSLQWRLSLWLGLAIALVWALAAAVTAQNLRHEMEEVFDSALAETGQRLLPLAVRDIIGRDSDDAASQSVATMREHDEHFTYVVRNAEGQVLLRSHKADPAIFPPFSGMGFSDTPTHRLYSDAALQGTITITVAEPQIRRRAVAWEVLVGLARPLALIVPISLIGVWAVIRLSTMSLRRFRSEIELRGAGDLTAVAADDLPSEIRPVARAVNQLLERLRRTLEAERSFAANSAHELRTPVAAALAQAQRLIVETTDAAARNRARDIETALRRLSALSEKLMQLARAEGGSLHGAEPVDIGALLRLIVDELTANAGAAGPIELALPDAPVLSRIDPDAFAILMRNLIENALKHGSQAEPVRVTLSMDGLLRIANAGPAVPQDLLARLLDPFERGRTQAKGAGLGLAIAKAIAAGTGSSLELISPREGHQDGFEVHLRIGRLG
ncbi:MAG: sensor histidine kinase N-terminal domain-containing protein [Bosea sp.]|uniref:sensor histidine kinase n=1 Tax=Bosea sp. (in: a-proteobacteria) TaxID=1871050 RepID=UPI001AD58F67|nr:ATP-binding protein [Bosea sp. (in: a-proteobacteria)]MBN9471460.1 sensor histidine kinase N-terminal domain-containing protein [Bosea sp. (in: a-proteobacteria)]